MTTFVMRAFGSTLRITTTTSQPAETSKITVTAPRGTITVTAPRGTITVKKGNANG